MLKTIALKYMKNIIHLKTVEGSKTGNQWPILMIIFEDVQQNVEIDWNT